MGFEFLPNSTNSKIVENFFLSDSDTNKQKYFKFCSSVSRLVLLEQKAREDNYLNLLKQKQKSLGRKLLYNAAFKLECSLPTSKQFRGADVRWEIRKNVVLSMLGEDSNGYVELNLNKQQLAPKIESVFVDRMIVEFNSFCRRVKNNEELLLENCLNPKNTNTEELINHKAFLDVTNMISHLVREKTDQFLDRDQVSPGLRP